MKVIRRGVFETNSSSTHSITMCSKEEYDKWNNGELLLDDGWRVEKQFITKEEAIEKLKNNEYYKDLDLNDEELLQEAFREEGIYNAKEYFENDDLEIFESEYKTSNGDIIIAFGKYGYDC